MSDKSNVRFGPMPDITTGENNVRFDMDADIVRSRDVQMVPGYLSAADRQSETAGDAFVEFSSARGGAISTAPHPV